MRFVLLIPFFLSSCFFGPVQELHDQIEETYFGSEFLDPPTPIKELNSKISVDIEVLWSENIGEHNGDSLDIFNIDEFIYIASSDGVIKKLSIETGDKIWEKILDKNITSGIAGNDESLFFSTSDGFLWAMDHDGELIWKTLLDGEVNSLPITYDSKVVVKINSYKIIQLNVKDGSIIWKYQAAIPPLTFKSEGKLVQSNNVVYLGLPGGKLIAIDSPTGGLIWESSISRAKGATEIERANDITSHPIIDGPVIFGVTTNGDISALDRRSGKTIWTKPLSSFYGMAFDGYNLFVTHDTGSIYSVNKEDGEVQWRQADLKYRLVKLGALIKDYIVFGDYEGYVHLLSVNDGSILARIKLGDSQILNNIIKIDESILLLMTGSGDVFCLKVGEETVSDNVLDKKDTGNEKEKTNNLKKHRVFDQKDDAEEKEIVGDEKTEKKESNLKKHRVFDKDKDKDKVKDKKGIFDWLF